MGLSPAEKVAVLIDGDFAGVGVGKLIPYLKALAKLSDVALVEALPNSPAPVVMVDPLRIMLDVKIDIAAEIARINKEIAAQEGQAEKARQKLANSNFVDRAPAAVVEAERNRLAQFDDTLAKLRAQLAKLETTE
jgi:valyl-tRNA synthetase